MAVLETARLLMRPPEGRDLDAFVEIHEDPEVLQYLSSIGPSEGRIAGWRMIAMLIGHWTLRGYGHWTVIEKSTGEVVGRVGLWFPEGWPGIELGWIISRSRWDRGYATEAARAAMRFGFEAAGLDHLISMIAADNVRSVRVAEKIGETLERREVIDGVDTLVYGIRRPGLPAR
jgi:RimJ/RimL family protein N-acetyltransferase